MSEREEILADLKEYGIGEILAQYMMNSEAEEIVNEYIQNLERKMERTEKERWKTAKNLADCRKKLKEVGKDD